MGSRDQFENHQQNLFEKNFFRSPLCPRTLWEPSRGSGGKLAPSQFHYLRIYFYICFWEIAKKCFFKLLDTIFFKLLLSITCGPALWRVRDSLDLFHCFLGVLS